MEFQFKAHLIKPIKFVILSNLKLIIWVMLLSLKINNWIKSRDRHWTGTELYLMLIWLLTWYIFPTAFYHYWNSDINKCPKEIRQNRSAEGLLHILYQQKAMIPNQKVFKFLNGHITHKYGELLLQYHINISSIVFVHAQLYGHALINFCWSQKPKQSWTCMWDLL